LHTAALEAVRPRKPPGSDRLPDLTLAGEAPWHHRPAEAAVKHLASDPERGLMARDAAQRLRRAGRNELPDIPRRPRTAIVAEQVASVPSLLLSTAAVFSFPTGALV